MVAFTETKIVIDIPEKAKAEINAASTAILKAMSTEPVSVIKKLQGKEMDLIDTLSEQIGELMAPGLESIQQELESAGFTVLISTD